MSSAPLRNRQIRASFLNFSPPLIGEEDIAEVVAALHNDWLTSGPRVHQFENEFAKFVGAPAALAVNSGTAAMHVALAAFGLRPGDEVITSVMTFVSAANVIVQLGAKPVLVDVEPDTLNVNPDEIRMAVTPRTRAIIPVHLYGHPAEMDPILELARQMGLLVLEDAAHALPASYRGRIIGGPIEGVASVVAFSFYATKNLTTGEGGMLTGSPEFIDAARVWALHGMSRTALDRYAEGGSWRYDVTVPGFKYNMPELQGALGLAQLRKLLSMQLRRREVVDRYDQAFSSIPELEVPTRRPSVESALHIYPLRLNLNRLRIDRAAFIAELHARNIGASVHFIPLHRHSYYRATLGDAIQRGFPVAEREFERLVSIPLNPRLSNQDIDDVILAVCDVVARFRV